MSIPYGENKRFIPNRVNGDRAHLNRQMCEKCAKCAQPSTTGMNQVKEGKVGRTKQDQAPAAPAQHRTTRKNLLKMPIKEIRNQEVRGSSPLIGSSVNANPARLCSLAGLCASSGPLFTVGYWRLAGVFFYLQSQVVSAIQC